MRTGSIRHAGRCAPSCWGSPGTSRSSTGGHNIASSRWTRTRLIAEPVDLDRGEVGDIVGRAVRALPPLQREVVILAEYEGLTLAEVARAVDADVGTIKSRLHRARENLRRTLAPLRSGQPTTT